MQDLQEFDEIRPYNDEEVPKVLARLSRDPELLDTLTSIKYPRLSRWVPWLLRPFAQRVVTKSFAGIDSVNALQLTLRGALLRLLENTETRVTVSGIKSLDAASSYLLLSNHRDITMDSALVNLVFSQNDRDTVRSAAGDNLLSKDIASDLLRLNKSFVVKRTTEGRREKLAALQQLSGYIRYSLLEEHCSVWIAQREGRAKDGLDKTETALLKMLALSKNKQQTFAEAIGELNPVPVSISYEFDPCDAGKARELYAQQYEGGYTKDEHEDVESIYRGVVGFKGHVHISICEPIAAASFETADELAALVDRAIIGHYYLHVTNIVAYEMLDGEDEFSRKRTGQLIDSGVDFNAVKRRFEERIADVNPAHKEIFLQQYANPVRAAKALEGD